jgi:hypothetical protein
LLPEGTRRTPPRNTLAAHAGLRLQRDVRRYVLLLTAAIDARYANIFFFFFADVQRQSFVRLFAALIQVAIRIIESCSRHLQHAGLLFVRRRRQHAATIGSRHADARFCSSLSAARTSQRFSARLRHEPP